MPYLHALCDAGCADLLEARPSLHANPNPNPNPTPNLLEARPSLHAWFERCRARPAWQAVVAMPAR